MCTFFATNTREIIRATTDATVKQIHTMATAVAAPFRFGGLLKFGTTPGGAFVAGPANNAFSAAGGTLLG